MQLLKTLESHFESGNTANLLLKLQEAVKSFNPSQYQEAFNRLVELQVRHSALILRRELLIRLEPVAPAWAAAIRNRQGIHGHQILPGDPEKAWLWHQLHDELDKRGQTSMEELINQIHDLSKHLRKITASLVEKKAWAAQAYRTTLTQRQALEGWRQIMRKIGKGTGKRVPQLMAEARRLMPVCQSAVPVWIMPLSRVAESFDPLRNRFDVVIIDEASQADALALVALYLGNQVIVVGDHEQVSPMGVGQKVEEIKKLIDTHLQDIPNAALYDHQMSIYDLAKTTFEPLCLREHFRCVEPIIQFSNYLSYEGKILPLRDAGTVKLLPSTVVYRVEGAIVKNKINEKEALTIASLLIACTEQPEYNGATFGVISLVGEEQADYIDRLLQQYLSPREYAERKIQCGNSAQFQGDERDVIFLSLVDATAVNGPLPMRGPGTQDMYKKRFNVAASRARDQLWVVYSLDPATNLKPGDLRLQLIKHAQNPFAISAYAKRLEQKTESEFEKLVLRSLVQAGYRVTPQWQVGAYRIDMVVEGGGKRLAVECDGDKWHPPEKLQEDIARQAILERLGWSFVRLRGSQFFRNPNQAMEEVFQKLREQEIPPEGPELTGSESGDAISEEAGNVYRDSGNYGDELKNRVIRQAVEIAHILSGVADDTMGEQLAPFPQPVGTTTQTVRGAESTKQIETKKQVNEVAVAEISSQPNAKLSPTASIAETEYTQISAENRTELFDLVTFLHQQGFTVVDKRPSGGALWVVGGEELKPVMSVLRSKGIDFSFAPKGGRATQHRPGWYTKQ